MSLQVFRHESNKGRLSVDSGLSRRPRSPGAASQQDAQTSVASTSHALSEFHFSHQEPHPDAGAGGRKGSRSSIIQRFTSPWSQRYPDSGEQEDGFPGEDSGLNGPVGLRLLHSSPEPLVDIVLVHGLRGGSVKTWRMGNHPRYFWPQNWLPLEPGFDNVNIHTFGYESDWASTKSSILNVHDFGQSLLEEMRNSPYIRLNKKVHFPCLRPGRRWGILVVRRQGICLRLWMSPLGQAERQGD